MSFRHHRSDWELTNANIESLVCAWTYTIVGQVLNETATSALDTAMDPERPESLNGTVTSPKRSEFSAHPQRTTSLPPRRSRVTELQGRTSMQSASESDLMSPPSSSGTDGTGSKGPLPGLPELITYRAELVMVRRKTLEQLAKQRAWLAGWAVVKASRTSKTEEVDLNGAAKLAGEETIEENTTVGSVSRFLSPTLQYALASEQDYRKAYERSSNEAMRLYIKSTQTKSAEAIMGDLAILKSQEGDFGYAVSYFQHVLPFYAAEGWSLMEAEALKMHAKCLRELDRKEEYVKTLLSLLAKMCGKKKERKVPRMKFEVVDDDVLEVAGILPEVVSFSEQLKSAVSSPAEEYFGEIRLDREVMHHEGKDGFALRLHVRHLLDDEIQLDEISARLVHADDPSQEIWIATKGPTDFKPGLNKCKLQSSVVTFGRYLVDKIVLKANKLYFVQEMHPETEAEPNGLGITDISEPLKPSKAYKRPWVSVYPPANAFSAGIAVERTIHVERVRSLDLRLHSGWNEISNLDLKLRPASAGLRLHLADAELIDVKVRNDSEPSSGQIQLEGLEAHHSAFVKIPYSLEQAAQEILIRFEARYNTPDGSFVFVSSKKISTELPVDVEVNDVFHLDALFSTFTVKTINRSPLSITGAHLEPSGVYDVVAPPVLQMPMTVFERQPVKLTYKILRKESASSKANEKHSLSLSLHYNSTEELMIECLRKRLADTLEGSPFNALSQLLLPLLAERSKSSLSKADIEMAALLHEVKLPAFEDLGWYDIVSTLPETIQQQLVEWLRKWHDQNPVVPLEHSVIDHNLLSIIIISVEVPTVDVVHKASLTLAGQRQHSKNGRHILALGQSLNAQLQLSSTRHWSADAIAPSGQKDKVERGQTARSFVFDVHADADSWLVGGHRRAHFIAEEGVDLTFDLLLVPLKLGTYSLPEVSVQPHPSGGMSEATQTQNEEHSVSCETHYESAGQVVQVIRDLRTARVHIPEALVSARPTSRPSTATTAKEAG